MSRINIQNIILRTQYALDVKPFILYQNFYVKGSFYHIFWRPLFSIGRTTAEMSLNEVPGYENGLRCPIQPIQCVNESTTIAKYRPAVLDGILWGQTSFGFSD